jgi:hypothetical protein
MIRPIAAAAAVALCLAAASGCRDRGAGTGVVAGNTGVRWLDERHDPVNVTLVYDTLNRVTRSVDSTGTTMTATGEDGTFFTLEIPKEALHGRHRISLIPVKRLDGLPLKEGGAVGMVQLRPEGLRFDRPVKLTIETEKPVPASERVAFAWAADGRDTHLFPAKGDSLEVQLELLHFSGYGFGQAPPNDPGRQHLAKAAAVEARLEAKVAEIINAERQKIRSGEKDGDGGFDLWGAIQPYMLEYFDAVIAPTMKIAETDDRMAACALKFYLGWRRQLELLGVLGESEAAPGRVDAVEQRVERAGASMDRIMTYAEEHALPRAQEGCRKHDLQAYNRVLAIARQMMLMGRDGETTVKNLQQVLEGAAEQCYRFELELVSDIQSRLPSGSSRYQLASRPTYVFKAEDNEAALNYQALEISGRPFTEMLNAFTGGHADALQDKRSPFAITDVSLSKRGSRHGTVRVVGMEPVYVTHDSVATGCTGVDDQAEERADTMLVVLRIEPPTEIVRFTSAVSPNRPHDADMHEWMRFFTRFRQMAGADVVIADGSRDDGQPEAREKPQLVAVKVAVQQDEPGVWRAEFNTKEGAMEGGKGLSETGHLLVRHTPK